MQINQLLYLEIEQTYLCGHGCKSALSGFSYQPTFNPVDKIVQLYDEKIALYERMLKEKDEMIVRLEKLIGK